MRFFSSKVLIVLAALALTAPAASAQSSAVYKWQDENGVTHYTTTPPAKGAAPAKLPEIMKGEVKLAKGNLKSCEGHGGINCQAGSDDDGSVICYDGFRDASPRFKFSCNAPKLQVAQISDPDEQGVFNVVIRNAKSVVAAKPIVTFKLESGKQVRLIGPDSIDAFGTEEFKFDPVRLGVPKGASDIDPLLARKPTIADITVACGNCP